MFVDDALRGFNSRLFIALIAFLSLNGLLMLRLYSVQIQGGRKHHKRIRQQSVRRIRVPPIRGRIIGSDGALFTDNRPVYQVYFHIHELRSGGLSKTLDKVQEQMAKARYAVGRRTLLEPTWDGFSHAAERPWLVSLVQGKAKAAGLGPRGTERVDELIRAGTSTALREWLVRRQILDHLRIYPALPLKIYDQLTAAELSRLSEVMPGIAGMEISTSYDRIYPQREVGAHLVGYIGRRYPSREEAREAYYFYPEREGKASLERLFDEQLRGHVGLRIVRVDSFGYYHEDLQDPQPAVPGDDILLTIDSRAQALGHQLLRGKRGSLVLLEVDTGAVLALVSEPSYDLQKFRRVYGDLLKDKNLPLLNRSLAGGYTPGSIIKPLVAMGILENNINSHDTMVDCPGYYKIGKCRIHCHRRSGHGPIHLVRGLEVSCNPYFIDSGLRLGIDRLSPIYAAAGLGEPTGIELRGSFDRGRLPSRLNMRRTNRRGWISVDTALVSIGQGFISLSPLQAAVYTAAIANGGKRYRPFMVRAIRRHNGELVHVTRPQIATYLPVSQQNLRIIQAGMYKVIHGDHATARIARTPLITLAGKTGTAEVGPPSRRHNNTWFICYGPYENPKYALAVLVEHGDSGGHTAAPIARRFFDAYLMISGEAQRR